MNTYTQHRIVHWDRNAGKTVKKDLLSEEPLSIRIQGNPYSVVMRTPGDEFALVAGFCLTEGIIDTLEDCTSIVFCEGADTNTVAVGLVPARRAQISEILDRRGFISQTGCGPCGKEIVGDLYQKIKPLTYKAPLDIHRAVTCLENITRYQPLRGRTRAAHAAVLYDSDFEPLAAAEDVGRHNALDKAIGKALLAKKLGRTVLLTLSSRISYELVQKSARARIPVILALSHPTALAVQLAAQLNITLATLAKGPGLDIFCEARRLQAAM